MICFLAPYVFFILFFILYKEYEKKNNFIYLATGLSENNENNSSLLYSKDGKNWNSTEGYKFEKNSLVNTGIGNNLYYFNINNNFIYLAGGVRTYNNSSILYSYDGITWKNCRGYIGTESLSITKGFYQNQEVLFSLYNDGLNQTIAISTDGVVWYQIYTNDQNYDIFRISFFKNYLILLTDDVNFCIVTKDLVNFTTITEIDNNDIASPFVTLETGFIGKKEVLVFGGQTAKFDLIYTPDLITWNKVLIIERTSLDIAQRPILAINSINFNEDIWSISLTSATDISFTYTKDFSTWRYFINDEFKNSSFGVLMDYKISTACLLDQSFQNIFIYSENFGDWEFGKGKKISQQTNDLIKIILN